MISLPQLWLPILLSAVLVFVASSLIHMVVKWHNSDYLALPNEDEVRAAIRKANPAPGQYLLPRISDMTQLKTPEVQRKFTEGPVGFLALKKSGTPTWARRWCSGSSSPSWVVRSSQHARPKGVPRVLLHRAVQAGAASRHREEDANHTLR
jgi:hypothetical protein